MKTVTLLSLRLTLTKKAMLAGAITARTSQSIFMAAEAEASTVVSTAALVAVSTVPNGAGEMAGAGDGEMPGDGEILTGATDGDLEVSITHGIAHTMADIMVPITDLTTETGMHPITIEVEEIRAMPLDDLNTIVIDRAFPTEVVIPGQKLAADRAELAQAIEILV
jgi:hypothetical protein